MNRSLSVTLLCCFSLSPLPGSAGIMREDVPVQEYRDFAENLGKYRPGNENISVFKSDGSVAGILQYPMPDFSAVNSAGYATLISPSYVTGVRHNGGYKTVDFGNNAKFKTTYKLINRNNSTSHDFHVPRLNKVVTEAAPLPTVKGSTLAANKDRYTWYTRVGTGTQYQVDAATQTLIRLSGAYKWKSGGTILNPTFESWRLRWYNHSPDDPAVQPLDSMSRAGDSGSPMLVYDNVDKVWRLAGVLTSGAGTAPYNLRGYILFLRDQEIADVLQKNTDPSVTDTAGAGDILWSADALRQGDTRWEWHGTDSVIPADASNEALDASKDLRFEGAGGTIVLQQSVNHGAARLQFSGNYRVVSPQDEDYRWVGGGIEVDEGMTVDWQVNGQAGDALHKIGAGTLQVNATGVNPGELNTGDGTVILNQQADSHGQRQAFSKITLVSGRPVVVLGSAGQIDSENIQFGYRGGTLDMNGQSLTFSEIKHNDDGARLLNNNATQASELILSGHQQTFSGSLGSAEAGGLLNLTTRGEWLLSGGATLGALQVSSGELQLSGQQVLHAGGVRFADDWLPQQYTAERIDLAENSSLTLAEHATAEASLRVADHATLRVLARSTLKGTTVLDGPDAQLIADISPNISTAGELASRIEASLSGEGSLLKTGEGRLTLAGHSANRGGVTVSQGELEVLSGVTGALTLHSGTRLSGAGSFADVTGDTDVTYYPGLHNSSDTSSVMRMNSLTTAENNRVILRAGASPAASDHLLISGDLNATEDAPLLISILSQTGWQDTDSNGNHRADNNEGITVLQVGGQSDEKRVKLAGEYVARGAWAYGLYAFAPGKSAVSERLLEGEGNQYWDYRLQNILLDSDGNTVPVVPEPDPQPHPEPQPEPGPLPVPDPSPVPVPDPQPVRPATTPQVPAYISLPAAFTRLSEDLQQMFSDSVREPRSAFFVYGYHSNERYHSAGNFANYGYDSTGKANGWMMGSRWSSPEARQQQITLGLAVSKGSLSVKPSAADGDSRSSADTYSINTLLRWQNDNGWLLEIPLAYTRFRSHVSTGLRGEVAAPDAVSWLTGLDAGKGWQYGPHRLTPQLGMHWQQLRIRSFTDEDNARVSYESRQSPDFSAGLNYRMTLGGVSLGADARVILRPGASRQVAISDGQTRNLFSTGRGGDSLQLNTDAAVSITDNLRITTRVRYQKRLEREGIDDWNIVSGMEVTF